MDRLMPGDQILSINGEDVARYCWLLTIFFPSQIFSVIVSKYFLLRAPRDHVIQLVRNCRETVSLVVCQPPLDNVSSSAVQCSIGSTISFHNHGEGPY